MLLVVAHAFWVRGRDSGWRRRANGARSRFGVASRAIAGAAGVAFVAFGAWIYYNTHVLNPFR